jgi:hypothetical protein
MRYLVPCSHTGGGTRDIYLLVVVCLPVCVCVCVCVRVCVCVGGGGCRAFLFQSDASYYVWRALVSLASFNETRQNGRRFKFLMIMYLQLTVSVDVTPC